MMQARTEEMMADVREALSSCCSETRRLLPDEVLAVPAVQHMLHTFLWDTSRLGCKILHLLCVAT